MNTPNCNAIKAMVLCTLALACERTVGSDPDGVPSPEPSLRRTEPATPAERATPPQPATPAQPPTSDDPGAKPTAAAPDAGPKGLPSRIAEPCTVAIAIHQDPAESITATASARDEAKVQLDAARCKILTGKGLACDGTGHQVLSSGSRVSIISGSSTYEFTEKFRASARYQGRGAGLARDLACRQALDAACTAAGLDVCPQAGIVVVEIDGQPADALRSALSQSPPAEARPADCVMTLRAADGVSSVRGHGHGASKNVACRNAVRAACADEACGDRADPRSVDGIPIDLLPEIRRGLFGER